MNIQPSLTISQTSLAYDDHIIFHDLNLTLESGQWTCLLGPSGIGKSSLLRLIAGLPMDEQTKMQACIQVNDQIPLKNRFSFLAQGDSLLPWLTALDNVVINEKLQGKKHFRIEQAKEILSAVGLQDAMEQYPHQLSGGMRQRVALARTFFEDKPIILMDEPFLSLDPITKNKLQALAYKLFQEKTVLLITHDPFEALRLGNNIYVLNGDPATLSSVITPKEKPLRETNTIEILDLHNQLMKELSLCE